MPKQSKPIFDFSYYNPMTEKQKDFHASTAMHKMLIGGVGAGKTYPAIHEAFFICGDNPNHEFAVFRNTWDSLEDNIMSDMLKIGRDANCYHPKNWNKSKHDLILYNGTKIMFRPLGMKLEQIKGMNLCGFLIDDPDVNRYRRAISFLWTRLRNPHGAQAKYFETIVCSNWEGKNFLWQTYMRRKPEGGNDKFAYWVCSSADNPTLPPHFIEDLRSIHSEAWMNRYVFCNLDSISSGLVYNEYNDKVHDADLSWCKKRKSDHKFMKILAIDVGITAATVVLKIATDFNKIYVYDEWYRKDARSDVVAEYIKRAVAHENFDTMIIDPSSAKREQTSGTSVRDDFKKKHGLIFKSGNRDINYGIEIIKSLLTVKDGKPGLYIDPVSCPNTVRELEIYRWKEPKNSEFEDLAYKEEPVDVDNDCMDTLRYGGVYFEKKLINRNNKSEVIQQKRELLWKERLSKMKMYQKGTGRNRPDPETMRLRKIHAHGTRRKVG